MIIAVSGVSLARFNTEQETQYKREFYQPQNKLDLKKEVKEDFGEIFANELSKLQINILI